MTKETAMILLLPFNTVCKGLYSTVNSNIEMQLFKLTANRHIHELGNLNTIGREL